MIISNIEKPVGSLGILVYISRNEKATITSLVRTARFNQRTAYSALTSLQNQHLIYHVQSPGFPMSKNYYLTPKGQKVAELLCEVENILNHEI